MPTRIDVTPDSALLVVRDADAGPAVPTIDRAALEHEASAGRLFFLAAEDPLRFLVDVYVGEAPPPELDRDFESLGGAFRLDVPSGRLAVAGVGSPAAPGAPIDVTPGPQLLTVMGRRAFDGKRHEAEMIALLGEADWRFSKRTDTLALLGCLPLLLAIGACVAALRKGRWITFLSYAVPILVVSWLPHLLLRWSARYRRIERAMAAHEGKKPHFILTLNASDQAPGLPGGFLNV